MSSSLIKDHKSKKACPQCEAHQLATNDDERAGDTMSIYYHCLNCNSQFFEHPGQNKSKDFQEKMSRRSTNGPSLTSGVAVVLMLLVLILTINVIRQNDSQGGVSQPASQLERR